MEENHLKKQNDPLPDLSEEELRLYEEKIDLLLMEMSDTNNTAPITPVENEKIVQKSFDELYQEYKEKIKTKYDFYYRESRLEKNKDDIENIFKELNTELEKTGNNSNQEINIQIKLSKEDDKKLNDLFSLLETEVKDKRDKLNLSGVKLSQTMSIDREALKKEFDKYEPEVLSQEMLNNLEEFNINLDASSSSDVPYPTNIRIISAFIIDILIAMTPDAISYQIFKISDLKILAVEVAISWVLFQILFTILLNGSIGQKILSLSFFNVNNASLTKPTKLALFKRSLSQIFPPFTILKLLSFRNKFAKQQKCIYCPISNTNITFSVFVS